MDAISNKEQPPTKADAYHGCVLAAFRNAGGYYSWTSQPWEMVAKETAIYPYWSQMPVIPTSESRK